MAFHEADYDTYVALGDPNATPLWNWSVWQLFLPAINPLVEAARGKPGIRSTQFLTDRKGVVKFGRLGWKESDHLKWAHGSQTNKEASKLWRFQSLEVWAPIWTACERDDRPPDIFLYVWNKLRGGADSEKLLFNPVVIFAVASETARREAAKVSAVVSALRELMSAKLVGFQRRPWGKAVDLLGSIGFTNAIQDLAVSGLFKTGPLHTSEIGFHLFAEKWEPA